MCLLININIIQAGDNNGRRDGGRTFGNDGYILTIHGLMADDVVQEMSKAGDITMHVD